MGFRGVATTACCSLVVSVLLSGIAVRAAAATPASGARSDSQAARMGGARSVGGGWPQQYFDLRNSSFNRSETTISPSNVADLTVAWHAPIDAYVDDRAGPIIRDGVVYVGTQSSVRAFDSTDGSLLWAFAVGTNSDVTGLAVWQDMVFATDIDDHAIYAIDAATGQEIWERSSTIGTLAPVVIHGVLLYSDVPGLHAVDARTGTPVWTSSDLTDTVPALDAGALYAVSGALVAIDPANGDELWRFQARATTYASVAISHHVAYWGTSLSDQGKFSVYAVDLGTHRLLWRSPVADGVYSAAAAAGGLVFVASTDGIVHAFDAATGESVWTAPSGDAGAPAVANGIVYAVGRDGLVQAFDMHTGEHLWSYDPPGDFPRHAVVADGSVYFGNGQYMFAMRLPSGEVLRH